jgi:hypothetical protein
MAYAASFPLPSLAHHLLSKLRASANQAGAERSATWNVPAALSTPATATAGVLQMGAVIALRGTLGCWSSFCFYFLFGCEGFTIFTMFVSVLSDFCLHSEIIITIMIIITATIITTATIIILSQVGGL